MSTPPKQKKYSKYDETVPHAEPEVECNHRIVRTVAEDLKINIEQVEEITKFFTGYIADTIRTGSLDGVTVPYLGKFHVKPYSQQYKDFLHSLGKEMKGYFRNNKDAAGIIFKTDEE